MTVTVITNNVPRETFDAAQLTLREREEFSYIDWQAVEDGSYWGEFFRYKGQAFDLSEFSAVWGITKGSGLISWLADWDCYQSDSYFSGMVVKYCVWNNTVVIGRYFS